MGRVLRLACGLMGMAILLTTAGMAWSRRDDASTLMLVRQGSGSSVNSFTVINPKTGTQLSLAPDYDVWFGPMIDSTVSWIYFGGQRRSHPNESGFYRVRPASKSRPQLITTETNILQVKFSSDGEWVVYVAGSRGSGDVRLYRARTTGEEMRELTDNMPKFWDIGRLFFSADDRWIAFNALNETGLGLYRVRLDGSEWYPINLESDAAYDIENWPSNSSTLIIHPSVGQAVYGIYSIPITGGQSQLLFSGLEQYQTSQMVYLGWIPQDNIALLLSFGQPNGLIIGGRPDETLLWTQEGTKSFAVSPDGTWLFLWGDAQIVRMRPDGSERQVLLQSPARIDQVLVSDEWLMYRTGDAIFRMRLDGTDHEELLVQPADAPKELAQWTPDGEYMIYLVFPPMEAVTARRRELYRMSADGRESRRLTETYYAGLVGWLPPIDRGWTPAHLGIIGAGLIGITIIRPKKWWDKKH